MATARKKMKLCEESLTLMAKIIVSVLKYIELIEQVENTNHVHKLGSQVLNRIGVKI
jgi:hypothetical protein